MTRPRAATTGRPGGLLTLLTLLALGAAGCAPTPPDLPLPAVDLASFASEVQPILERRCGSPSCHGRVERPLALYGSGSYRADPTRRFLLEPLTPDELAANARSVAVFVLEPRERAAALGESLVLCKPLALAAGGCGHQGGVQWLSPRDREYRQLASWLEALP
ncbi:MAG: hypothetical protein IT370_13175 [Deltaproteobacteria bacterium]|nr:hypothetical protein [Deltaproteobacteria bacterium]